MSSSTATVMADDRRYTKHGFPKGFRFVPTNVELVTILSYMIQGRRLHPKVAAIFHHLNILDHHPEELHDMYGHDKEHRYIYFFSYRQRQRSAAGADGGGGGGPVHKKRQRGAGAGGGQDEDDSSEPRPVRMAKGGGWKPSGGGHMVRCPNDGFVAGKMVTMVFYDHRDGEQVKSQWGMHEFTVPLHPRKLPKATKTTRLPLHDLALYRLYRLKSGGDTESDDGAGSNNNQTPANVAAAAAAAADGGHFSAPRPASQPSFGIFTGHNQPLAAGASAARMPPPPPPPQLQQHRVPNVVGHPQFYQHHQYAFGGAQQQVRTMATPPAYGARMLPGRQLPQYARPPAGNWLPARPPLQFARPPAPSQMPRLPAAGNSASSHQQAPAKATYGGTGQQASHSGAMRFPLPSAPVATPPPAAKSLSMEELAPMTAAIHGGAGQEQGATATAEPGQHVQFADSVQPEETVPAPTPADNNDGMGMLDYDFDLGVSNDNCLFTMAELYAMFDEPPPTLQGEDN